MKNTTALLALLFLASLAPAQTFKGESVEYDPTANRFLSSDDGTAIVQRAADGAISYFGTGTRASYGMEILNGQLWAIDGKDIIGYDLATAAQIGTATIAGASFLNGLASDGISKKLWATDFNGKKIYAIDIADPASPVVSTLVAAFGGTPNGACFDEKNNRLVVVSWGASAKIKAVDISTGALTDLATTALTNIDGIDNDAAGNFYLASWSPAKITKYLPDFSASSTVTVAGGVSSPADITYARPIDTLAIPNTGGNNIKFVGFPPPVSAQEAEKAGLSIKISPNPAVETMAVDFVLPQNMQVEVSVIGADGRRKLQVLDGKLPPGANRLFVENLASLPPGTYFLRLKIGREIIVEPFSKI